MSQTNVEDYWLQWIRLWYPEFHSRTYFLPPLHFNRVPYTAGNIFGKPVLVAQVPKDPCNQTASTEKLAQPSKTCNQGNNNRLLRAVYDKDVRYDNAQQKVLQSLRAFADNSQPKEVMMVVSQLQFGKYLNKPSYQAAASFLPRPSTLPDIYKGKHYYEGDFDVLIIHKRYGLTTIEIKSVGSNFNQLNLTVEEKDEIVVKKVTEAIQQLNKAEVVLKHLVSDLGNVKITKTLALPNIQPSQLLRAINISPLVGEHLCHCLCTKSIDEAVRRCLLSEQVSEKPVFQDVTPSVLRNLRSWWQQLFCTPESQTSSMSEVYERIVARFCGPAVTVDVHCVIAPPLELRTEGQAVYETGERIAQLVLYQEQVEILQSPLAHAFLTGPPGTGKTIVLILKGLAWLQHGHDVYILSTCSESRGASILIKHQLKETFMAVTSTLTENSSHVYMQHFDFDSENVVEDGLQHFTEINDSDLCLLADEVYSHNFAQFCEQLMETKPNVRLWAAAVQKDVRPPCLEEVRLTTPLRSPPVVTKEVMMALEIQESGQVYNYTIGGVPVPTEGPPIRKITHRNGQSNHKGGRPSGCIECGHQVAKVLIELNVGFIGGIVRHLVLQYRDVMVLCNDYPCDDETDSNGVRTLTASGLVVGLRSKNIPVHVVVSSDDDSVSNTALALENKVTVANWNDVRGLERKIVVVMVKYRSDRLHSMSRCTSQLVCIEF